MILWRLTPAKHAATALDGQGAAKAGGRWNSMGLPAVYLSVEPATTILETLTTFTRATAPDGGFQLLKIDYTGSTQRLGLADLPQGWDKPDDAGISRPVGDLFLSQRAAGVLLIPSVVLKVAINAVLNPLHPDAAAARILESTSFSFDPRWPLK